MCGRSGEGEEGRFGKGVSHVQGEGVILAPVGLVGDDDNVIPLR